MVQRNIYVCKNGAIVEGLTNPVEAGDCEGLTLVEANSVEAAVEKHVPVIEAIDGGYKVTVGSVLHPMLPEHYIQWIELNEGDKCQIQFLNPGEEPIATFKTDAKKVSAREYCNLHGLWIAE